MLFRSLWQMASSRALPNVTFHHGSSLEVLPIILPRKSEPLLYWLDAHYSGSHTDGFENTCPVLGEIALLGLHKQISSSIVLIDDARLFCVPHDLAPKMDGWPKLREILAGLENYGLETFFYEDVVIALPDKNVHDFMDFLLPQVIKRQKRVYEFYSKSEI